MRRAHYMVRCAAEGLPVLDRVGRKADRREVVDLAGAVLDLTHSNKRLERKLDRIAELLGLPPGVDPVQGVAERLRRERAR